MDLTNLPAMLDNAIVSPNVMASIVVIIIALVALFGMRHASKRYRERMRHSDLNGTRRDRIFRSIQVTVRYGVIVVAIIAIMQVNGVNISALAVGLGVVGIIVAFALQDALADLAMGVRIVTDNYFSTGDTIRIDDYEGEVIAFSPQSTKINSTKDDTVLTISNRKLDHVILLSTLNDIDVPIYSKEVPLEHIDELFEAICARLLEEYPSIKKALYVGVQEYKDCWVSHRLRLWARPRSVGSACATPAAS
ncbi:MAG: mechanosensitive ion channel family protein [Coriobacteriales bacterium]